MDVIRKPKWAGRFYPASKQKLLAAVKEYVEQEKKEASLEKDVIAVLAPHAGYTYSGTVAGTVFRQIQGKQYDIIILIGPPHHVPMEGIVIDTSNLYETPVGSFRVDEEISHRIVNTCPGAVLDHEPHIPEHSIEVELPFISYCLGETRIIPVLIRARNPEEPIALARAIHGAVMGKSVLLVASSDLSHYPQSKVSQEIDPASMDAATTLDPVHIRQVSDDLMRQQYHNVACTMCGLDAVMAVAEAAKLLGAEKATVLDVRNSHDAGGDADSVVGYGGMVAF